MLKCIYPFGLRIRLYDVFNGLAYFLMLAHNLLYYRKSVNRKGSLFLRSKKKLSLKFKQGNTLEFPSRTPAVYVSAVFVLTCVQFFSGVVANKLLGNAINDGSDNYFGFAVFAPIIFLLFCKVLKLDGFDFLDAFTPGYAISLVSFKIACFCAGCCSGTESFMAVYYPAQDNYQFPIQMLECFVAIVIFFILRSYRLKAPKGTVHPMYLILYSSTRFFTEFLRREPDILWHFKFYHFLCAAGVVIGIIEFKLAKRYCSKPAVRSKVKAHK